MVYHDFEHLFFVLFLVEQPRTLRCFSVIPFTLSKQIVSRIFLFFYFYFDDLFYVLTDKVSDDRISCVSFMIFNWLAESVNCSALRFYSSSSFIFCSIANWVQLQTVATRNAFQKWNVQILILFSLSVALLFSFSLFRI